jgi:hypothetical protein
MTTPTEISLNGTQSAPKSDSVNKTSPASNTIPAKAVNGTSAKMNGHASTKSGSNETSVIEQPPHLTTEEHHLNTPSQPPTPPEVETSEQEVPHGDMSGAGSPTEENMDTSGEQKRDLYVGNLYSSHPFDR